MRLKITLKTSNPEPVVPINYQYPVASAIYRILKNAEPEFSKLLHEKGYPTEHNRRFKFFTFSKMFFPNPARVKNNTLLLNGNESIYFLISSFNEEEFIKKFIIGLFESQEFPIGLKNVCHTNFKVAFVEALPEPVLQGTLKCIAISPVCVSVNDGSLQPTYLRALDSRIPDAIKKNLLWKYRTLFNKSKVDFDGEFNFQIDADYIQKAGGEERVSKLITIKENQPDETKVRGFIAPFTLSGPDILLKIAYNCGIGEKNSIGFGMFKVENTIN
ncbi:MAG: CRISPR repeat RNA endoribonuclease Cas6 [Ignavibacteriae bacterium]|nr:MAG: CRISPR repeat RNA endoribonuclease Cas6 [Ignavibacteriota bacterium]